MKLTRERSKTVDAEIASHAVDWLDRNDPNSKAASLTVSVVFTAISTLFNLFAMRRGVLIVGEGRGTLLADLRQIPRLVVLFVASILCLSKRSI